MSGFSTRSVIPWRQKILPINFLMLKHNLDGFVALALPMPTAIGNGWNSPYWWGSDRYFVKKEFHFMPELRLQRNAGTLIVELGEHSASVPLERVFPPPKLWKQIYEDAATYGRN